TLQDLLVRPHTFRYYTTKRHVPPERPPFRHIMQRKVELLKRPHPPPRDGGRRFSDGGTVSVAARQVAKGEPDPTMKARISATFLQQSSQRRISCLDAARIV